VAKTTETLNHGLFGSLHGPCVDLQVAKNYSNISVYLSSISKKHLNADWEKKERYEYKNG